MITQTDGVTGLSLTPATKLSLGSRRAVGHTQHGADIFEGTLTDASVFVSVPRISAGVLRVDLSTELLGARSLVASAFIAGALGYTGLAIAAQGIACESWHVSVSSDNPRLVVSNVGLAVRDCCGAHGVHVQEPLLAFPPAGDPVLNAIGPMPLGEGRGQFVARTLVGAGAVNFPSGSRLLFLQHSQISNGIASVLTLTDVNGDTSIFQVPSRPFGDLISLTVDYKGLLPIASLSSTGGVTNLGAVR